MRAGQSVLVIGAAGDVGAFAVQIATSMGAEVTGVCSTAKADLVNAGAMRPVIDRVFALHEADDAIDYLAEGHATGKVVIVP